MTKFLCFLFVTVLLISNCYAETPSPINDICTPSDGYQGFTFDGTYFYVGDSIADKVYKYDSDCTSVTNFDCPSHCNGLDIREDHDTLLASSSGTSRVFWEVNKTSGVKIREWDMSAEYAAGHIYNEFQDATYFAEDTVLVYTQNASDYTKLGKYTVNDNGTFSWIKTWSTETYLGNGQEIEYVKSIDRVFKSGSSGGGVNKIYELELSSSDTSISVERTFDVSAVEIEGIVLYGDEMYYNEWSSKDISSFTYLYLNDAGINNAELYSCTIR